VGGTCGTNGGREDSLQVIGKPKGRRSLERARHRWVDNIKIDLVEIGWRGTDWIDLVQNRWRTLVDVVLNLRIP
jgi:hypothetical protein